MKRYYDLNSYFKNLFGERVHKLTIDAGLSCPNRDGTLSTGGCIYCNARGSGTGAFKKGLSIKQQLENSKPAVARRFKAKKFIAYFQSFSNTYAQIDKLKSLYDEALSVADIVGIFIGTRPDCVDEPVLALLENYAKTHLVWIEYGLQSSQDNTLEFINRGHDVACFLNAVNTTLNRGIKICAHVILGLPGETREHMLETADLLATTPIDGIKLHLLYVIKGTPLEKLYKEGNYRCLEQAEYVDILTDFLERLPKQMVIQRLTGDPHAHELIAPKWALNKSQTLDLIHKTLEQKDTWQGKKFME